MIGITAFFLVFIIFWILKILWLSSLQSSMECNLFQTQVCVTPFCLVFLASGFFTMSTEPVLSTFSISQVPQPTPKVRRGPCLILNKHDCIFYNNNSFQRKDHLQVNSMIQPFLYLGINGKLGKALVKKISCCSSEKRQNAADQDPHSKTSTVTI